MTFLLGRPAQGQIAGVYTGQTLLRGQTIPLRAELVIAAGGSSSDRFEGSWSFWYFANSTDTTTAKVSFRIVGTFSAKKSELRWRILDQAELSKSPQGYDVSTKEEVATFEPSRQWITDRNRLTYSNINSTEVSFVQRNQRDAMRRAAIGRTVIAKSSTVATRETAPSQEASATKRSADTTEPATLPSSPSKPVGAVDLIHSTDAYDLYTHLQRADQLSCVGTDLEAYLVLSLKVPDDYVVFPDSTFQRWYADEIRPRILALCAGVTISVFEIFVPGDHSNLLTRIAVYQGSARLTGVTDSLPRFESGFPISLTARREASGALAKRLEQAQRAKGPVQVGYNGTIWTGGDVESEKRKLANRPLVQGELIGEMQGVKVYSYFEEASGGPAGSFFFTVHGPAQSTALFANDAVRAWVRKSILPNGTPDASLNVTIIEGKDTTAVRYLRGARKEGELRPMSPVFGHRLLDTKEVKNPSGLALRTEGLYEAWLMNEVFYGQLESSSGFDGPTFAAMHNIFFQEYGFANPLILPVGTPTLKTVISKTVTDRNGNQVGGRDIPIDYLAPSRYHAKIEDLNVGAYLAGDRTKVRDAIFMLLKRHPGYSPALRQFAENLHRLASGLPMLAATAPLPVPIMSKRSSATTSVDTMTLEDWYKYERRDTRYQDHGAIPEGIWQHRIVKMCDEDGACAAYWLGSYPPMWEKVKRTLSRDHTLLDQMAAPRRVPPASVRALMMELARVVVP